MARRRGSSVTIRLDSKGRVKGFDLKGSAADKFFKNVLAASSLTEEVKTETKPAVLKLRKVGPCDHANEVPSNCTCRATCVCRGTSCPEAVCPVDNCGNKGVCADGTCSEHGPVQFEHERDS